MTKKERIKEKREKNVITILCFIAVYFSNKLIYSDIYLNNSTWLGWFVREIDRELGIFSFTCKNLQAFRSLLLWSLLSTSEGCTEKVHWNSVELFIYSVIIHSGCYNKSHRSVPYQQHKWISQSLGGCKSQMRVPVWLGSGEGAFQVTNIFSLCPYRSETSFIRALISLMRAELSWPNPKGPTS